MTKYPRLRVAAAHAASVWMESDATADKAARLIAEAAREGAQLVVFPESFMPGFPIWTALAAPIHNHRFFERFAAASVRVDGPEIAEVRAAARRHAMLVSIGFSEATDTSVGCLWNSSLLIGPDGAALNHHRKLVPTFYEKLTWAPGDGAGLHVVDTPIGRIGGLICGENSNPLARFALMAQGEQIHTACFPSIWPTRVPGDGAGYDIEEAIRIRCGAHSFEAKCFTVVASGVLDAEAIAAMSGVSPEAETLLRHTPRAVSMVIGPDGRVRGDVRREEGLLLADIDLADCVEQKQFHDVVGYYNRFDVFHFEVDRTSRRPALFHDHPQDAARAAADTAEIRDAA